MSKDGAIWELEHKYLTGGGIEPSDVETAIASLSSESIPERIIACEAIMRCECAQEIKERACDEVVKLCRDWLSGRQEINESLILVILQMPKKSFAGSSILKQFAFEVANDRNPGMRMNNILILERLARLGDQTAKELLVHARDDVDELVRKNATNSLERVNG